MQAFNYCSRQNGAAIYSVSSENNPVHGSANNILLDQENKVWTSESGLPQFIVVDLRNLHKRHKQIRFVGFNLWHDYQTNPKSIELQIRDNKSGKGDDFILWSHFELQQKTGIQYFEVDAINFRFNLIKLIVTQTFGANQTYLNQLLLFAQDPDPNRMSAIEEDQKKFEILRQSQVHSLDEEQERMIDHRKMLQHTPMHSSISLKIPTQPNTHNLDQIFNQLQLMKTRVESIEARQEGRERQMMERLEKHIERRIQQKFDRKNRNRSTSAKKDEYVMPPSIKKDGHVMKLIKELTEKLMLREQKLKKLKKKALKQ